MSQSFCCGQFEPKIAWNQLLPTIESKNLVVIMIISNSDVEAPNNTVESNLPRAVMLHKCIGSISYKDQYWEHFACNVSKKESKEKVADILMPEIIGYKVKEQVRGTNHE